MPRTWSALSATLALCACQDDGLSTREMRSAAVAHAREVLRLPAAAGLEATVWVGEKDYDGKTVMCGTVSGKGQAAIIPQRFAATASPLRWLVFQDAHAPMRPTTEGKFPNWGELCAGSRR